MNTIDRFHIRGLCGVLAVALGLGLAQPVYAEGQPQRQWARQPGTPAHDTAFAVATDKQGNVYVTGDTGGSLAGPQQGDGDAWIKKISTAGVLLWQRQPRTSDSDIAFDVATDGAGNVYIVGGTLGSLGVINHGAQDPWIFKYSAAGVLLWKRQIGTPAHDGAGGVATDQQGNVYIAGTTVGSLAGPHRGADDAFIVKYLQRP